MKFTGAIVTQDKSTDYTVRKLVPECTVKEFVLHFYGRWIFKKE